MNKKAHGSDHRAPSPKRATSAHPTPKERISTPPLVVIMLFVATPIIIIDQVSKAWALHHFTAHEPYPLLGRFLSIEVVRNPGAAFSFAENFTWVFTIIAFIVLIGVSWTGRSTTTRSWQIVFGMIAGGSAGNLIDRLVRPPSYGQGHVIDFINYAGFFVGNIADLMIVLGVMGVVILVAVNIPLNRERARAEQLESETKTIE